jgi:uncharacterized Zn finger protein
LKEPSGKRKKRDPWRDIKDYLSGQSPEILIELLLDVARRDDRLFQALSLKVGRGAGEVSAAKAFRRAIDDATSVDDDIDWREVSTYAGNIDDVVDSLAELLKPDTAASLVELAEYAIEKVEKALEQVDDSNGEIGSIVEDLGTLHLKACTMSRPDPAGLAERLFRFEMRLPFNLCSFNFATYRGVLGKEGLHRYRHLAETEWAKVEPRNTRGPFDYHRTRITHIMEGLAHAAGDVEELVAIKARDLTSGYDYLAIAEIWAKAKQPDKALDWAERGLKAFSDRIDNRLRDFLVTAYLKGKRNDEALQLTWVQFDERPCLAHYEKLHGVAGKLGVWPAQRDRALARIAQTIAREASKPNMWTQKPSPPNYSLRVEIALWERDLDAAWSALQVGTCDRRLIVELAGKLESLRPGDAVSLYRGVVPAIVEQTDNASYEEAIKLIRKVGTLMSLQKQLLQFDVYLAELRRLFKAKRNFIKLLDKVAASTPH